MAQGERVRLKRAGEPPTAEAVKAALVASGPDRVSADFLAYADRHVDALRVRGQIREHKRQRAVFKKLRAWSGDALPFDRLTPRLLKDYETHLLGLGNKPSTVNSNFRVVRTVLYAAIREGGFPQERNPFARFKLIKKNAPDRPKLTAEQVAALERVDLGGRGPGGPLVSRVRDYFLFSFYGAGVRFTDVDLMRRSNVALVDGERGPEAVVSYVMGKTGKPTTVRMAPGAADLVRPYLERPAAGDDPFLFPMLDGYDVSTPEGLVKASRASKELQAEVATFGAGGPGTGGPPTGGPRQIQDNSLTVSWDNPADALHYVVVESLVEGEPEYILPEFIRNRFGGFRFITEPTDLAYFDVNAQSLQVFGEHRVVVYRVNEEYADLYENREQDSRDLNEPPTNVTGGLGVFSAFNSRSATFDVVEADD